MMMIFLHEKGKPVNDARSIIESDFNMLFQKEISDETSRRFNLRERGRQLRKFIDEEIPQDEDRLKKQEIILKNLKQKF
jgi:hypothetical protein